MVWYFAYGSNMDPARLVEARLKPKGVAVVERIGGRLEGWRLAFNKPSQRDRRVGAANIVPVDGAVVHGTLNAMPPQGLDVLDLYEGATKLGHYRRQTVSVVLSNGNAPVEVITYVAVTALDDSLRPAR